MTDDQHTRSTLRILFFTGLVLGLGWAIRGVFGHWWGASWAGGMGTMALLFMIRNPNWLQRLPTISVLGAIGWGVGGIMSYGIVIGYCRATDFGNSWYGYSMLAVIGGLYGFIGGGLPALAMESRKDQKPDWPRLLVEMSVIGYLTYWLLITEMEWYMTPPRSEDWAVSFGASFALAWYAYRNKFYNTLRVAAYAALGAGFGFSFGNFIQTMGAVSGVSYNWWNVMEFALGFFGGLGMAYGVMRSSWPEISLPARKAVNWTALIVLFFAIPFINLFQQFSGDKLTALAERLEYASTEQFIVQQQWMAFAMILIFTGLAIYAWRKYGKGELSINQFILPAILLFSYSLFYMLFGYLKHGSFYSGFQLARSETSYWFLFVLMGVMAFVDRKRISSLPAVDSGSTWRKFCLLVAILMVVLIILALISTASHDGLAGAQERF
ncbi:MAG: hypothetical protein R2824_21985 [Saprospiraceae bacterium]|nr:hypothetical protein [Lewinella sp.]